MADVAARLRRPGIQPAPADHQDRTSASCARRGAGRCRTVPTKARRCFTTACCSSTPTATRSRRSTPSTGDLLWQYSRRLPMGTSPSVKRAIALYGDKVYTGTSDTHIVALDAKTGRVVWDTPIADAEARLRSDRRRDSGQRARSIASTTGRAPGGNFIVALDAQTGKEAWRFGTIPRDGESGGNTWNGMPHEKRNGGSVWVPGSYDSTTGLLYIGVGQTYDTGPYRDPAAGANNDLLFTDSTLAIDPGHRQAGVALPAPAERSVGLRLGVHAHAVQADAGRPGCSSAPAASRRSTTISTRRPANTPSRSTSACRTSSPASIRRRAPSRSTRA